jgi:hypothetical protein
MLVSLAPQQCFANIQNEINENIEPNIPKTEREKSLGVGGLVAGLLNACSMYCLLQSINYSNFKA